MPAAMITRLTTCPSVLMSRIKIVHVPCSTTDRATQAAVPKSWLVTGPYTPSPDKLSAKDYDRLEI